MILNYGDWKPRNSKPRALQITESSIEEAAIYDLVFNDVPLRIVAKRIGLSYQGVYIRALVYMQYWRKNNMILMDPNHSKYLTDLYSENNQEGDASVMNVE